jgi:superfamily II DNA/RNA helicase
VKTFFVPMTDEQQARYDDYAFRAAKLAKIAERRPLTKEEFDRLQMLMACMRMICDTPAILDPNCRDSPKLEELGRILEDLLQDPERKIIIFSEWERMLSMIRELASEFGVEAAWHTGSTPQLRRREEINRFKQDPACRLFLSTDSGAVGLNLQVASVVINVDLPWNPAKLEQRIARAWRKHQTRSVSVINLVSEKTIEHSILFLLGAKQALSDARPAHTVARGGFGARASRTARRATAAPRGPTRRGRRQPRADRPRPRASGACGRGCADRGAGGRPDRRGDRSRRVECSEEADVGRHARPQRRRRACTALR